MIDNKKTKPPPSWSLHLKALQSSFSWSWACLSHQEKEFNSPILHFGCCKLWFRDLSMLSGTSMIITRRLHQHRL
jgi:hypothetical protein